MATLRYARTAERPEAVLQLPDAHDVSTGYTFTVRIGHKGDTALLTKTDGITGGDGQVVVAWDAGELDQTPGRYHLELTATTGELDRVYECVLAIGDVIA